MLGHKLHSGHGASKTKTSEGRLVRVSLFTNKLKSHLGIQFLKLFSDVRVLSSLGSLFHNFGPR